MNEDLEQRLNDLLAKQEIHERLMRYCRGADRGDPALISQAFHPDAMADHGHVFFTGDTIGEVLAEMVATHTNASGVHFTGNELIEIDGERAYSELYFISFIERDRDGDTLMVSRCARYIDRWEQRDGTWGITYRRVVSSWDRVEPLGERWPTAGHFLLSEIGRGDAIYDVRTAEARRPEEAIEGPTLVERVRAAGYAVNDQARPTDEK